MTKARTKAKRSCRTKALAPLTDAQRRLVEDNMGLVKVEIKRAEKWAHDPEDLYQIASMGLMRAAYEFDAAQGYAFSTFAIRCIRTALWHYQKVSLAGKRDPRKEAYSLDELAHKHREGDWRTHGEELTSNETPENLAIAHALMDVLLGLPDERIRNVLLMRMQGYTQRDIGAVYGISGSRVQQLVNIGRQMVREVWCA